MAPRPGNVHSAHEWRDVLDPVVLAEQDTPAISTVTPPSPRPRFMSFWKRKASSTSIRLPMLHDSIAHLLKRPVGRPKEVRRYYANFSYRAGSWTEPRRVVAKVEWHSGELYTRVGLGPAS